MTATYKTEGAYRVDVLARGEVRWASNALRFDSEAEADEYAHDLSSRWTLVEKMRVVPSSHPEREEYKTFEPGDKHCHWGMRHGR
jgi:hypothetical protein